MSYILEEFFMLENLGVSEFVTNSVATMYHMFDNCNSLRTLSISNFDASKVNNF